MKEDSPSQISIEDQNNGLYFIHESVKSILDENFEAAIIELNQAIELDPSLIAYQLRALCQSFLYESDPTNIQVIKIVLDLTESLSLTTKLFENLSESFSSTSDIE